jgi:AsmA family
MATAPFESQLTRRHLGRMLLVLCIGLVGLVILVLALLPYVVSLEWVQRALVSRVEAALQRPVAIGAVRLQILTGLGATLEDVTLANPPGWPQPHLIRIGTLSVKVAPLPLLQRTIAITKMVVRDGDLVITRDPTGQMNLADLAASHRGLANVPAPHPPQAPPADAMHPGGHPLASWLLSDVTLEAGKVTFVDWMAIPGEVVTTTVSDVWGHLRDISLNGPIPFDMGATVLTDGNRNIRVRGRVGLIPENLAIEGATIDAELQAADLLLAPLSPYLGPSLPLVRGRVGAQTSPQHPGSVPFPMKADDGGLWNTEGGIFGKEVRIHR